MAADTHTNMRARGVPALIFFPLQALHTTHYGEALQNVKGPDGESEGLVSVCSVCRD